MADSVTFQEFEPNLVWFHPPDGGEVYILKGSDGHVLIDSGLGHHREALQAAMVEAGIDVSDIRLAIATHFHCDHVGDLGWWQREFDLPVVAHRMAVEPMGQADPVVTGSEIPFSNWKATFEPCKVTDVVEGGEVVTVGDISLRFEPGPGHSISGLHIFSGDLVFVGDNLFGTSGIGWMDIHWGSNPETYIQSIESLRPHVGKMVCAGHGMPFVLEDAVLDKAIEILKFHIPPEHGMGIPRP
jgi:glyoxylase-like metal-dependent hydrolase (beta-lactamase superfamily II)